MSLNILNIFKVSTEKESLGNKFRKKRFESFLKLTQNLEKPISILDIGGNPNYWKNVGLAGNPDYEIVLLNLDTRETDNENIRSVQGDATNLSEYTDQSFDIVFSNSVIEHLYNHENQGKMANEAMRVGKYYFIQTPNKHFPIEAHYMLPFIQYLPKNIQYKILTQTKLSRLRKWPKKLASEYTSEIVLLTKRDMKKLFPKAKIIDEKYMLMNKSFTAHNL